MRIFGRLERASFRLTRHVRGRGLCRRDQSGYEGVSFFFCFLSLLLSRQTESSPSGGRAQGRRSGAQRGQVGDIFCRVKDTKRNEREEERKGLREAFWTEGRGEENDARKRFAFRPLRTKQEMLGFGPFPWRFFLAKLSFDHLSLGFFFSLVSSKERVRS